MVEATKAPTRDYPSLAINSWAIWDTLYGRRSNRKYLPMRLESDLAGKIEDMIRLALRVRGAGPESLILHSEAGQVERVKKASYKRMEGAVNLWLLRTPVSGFLVLAVPRDDVSCERPRLLPHTAMATQDMVLWLTEAGLGTCWMGGVNDGEVRKAIGLGDKSMVPAIIAIGKRKPKIEARDLDTFLYHRLTRRRKAIRTIASEETYGVPFLIDKAPGGFAVSENQGVEGLLRAIEKGEWGGEQVPIETAIEACLEAARVSPSAGNQQKWHFVVVRSKEGLAEVAEACGRPAGWRAAIVGAGYAGKLYAMIEKPFWMLDLPIAFSQMSLMAASMDLGFDLLIDECDEKELAGAIELPPELRAFGVLGLK
jgi:nitroreductase